MPGAPIDMLPIEKSRLPVGAHKAIAGLNRAHSVFHSSVCCRCVADSIRVSRGERRRSSMYTIDRYPGAQGTRAHPRRKCRSAPVAALMGPDLTSHMLLVFRKGWCTGSAHSISETAIVGPSRPDARDGRGRRKAKHISPDPKDVWPRRHGPGFLALEPVRTPKG